MSAFIEQYNIMFKGLKTGVHHFSFDLDNRFFGYFESPDCHGGDIAVSVEIEKKSHLLTLVLVFSGNVKVICDRCLEELDMPLEFESKLYVKFGEEGYEKDAEVLYLDVNENNLNVAEYFIESIRLNLPIKRVHKKDKNGNDLCNKLMIEKINEHRKKNTRNRPDPRWNSLKDMFNKKN